jgi:hypothetical protein
MKMKIFDLGSRNDISSRKNGDKNHANQDCLDGLISLQTKISNLMETKLRHFGAISLRLICFLLS